MSNFMQYFSVANVDASSLPGLPALLLTAPDPTSHACLSLLVLRAVRQGRHALTWARRGQG